MKKGFTLVELLAVIVILAVILVIAVPQINNVIKETRKNSLGSTAKLIAAKAEEKEVENDALGNNESITCADLVKLDNNYGNCRVSKNSTTGKWEVTIVGSGKFSGYTCTGTKDNMSCTEGGSNTPEYVYSFEATPYYDYTYEVKEGKTGECITYLENNMKDVMINDWGRTTEEAQSEIEAVCSNSSDIYNEPEDLYSTSDWFVYCIQYGYFTYENISSFVEKGGSGKLVNAVEDYTQVKYPGTNEQAKVFIRWPGNTVNFDSNDEKEVCILYKGNTNNDINCFKYTTYDETLQSIANVFGKSNCSGDGVEELTLLDKIFGIDNVYAAFRKTAASCTNDSWSCEVSVMDGLTCSVVEVGNSVRRCTNSICVLRNSSS